MAQPVNPNPFQRDLEQLSRANDLKVQGKLIYYNITAYGLEEKGLFGKFLAFLANMINRITNDEVFLQAHKSYLEIFKNRFTFTQENTALEQQINTLANQTLFDPKTYNQTIEQVKQTLKPENFKFVEEGMRKDFFQALTPEYQKQLVSENPENFKFVEEGMRKDFLVPLSSEDKIKIFSTSGLTRDEQKDFLRDLTDEDKKNMLSSEFLNLADKRFVFKQLEETTQKELIKEDIKNYNYVQGSNRDFFTDVVREIFPRLSKEEKNEFFAKLDPVTRQHLVCDNIENFSLIIEGTDNDYQKLSELKTHIESVKKNIANFSSVPPDFKPFIFNILEKKQKEDLFSEYKIQNTSDLPIKSEKEYQSYTLVSIKENEPSISVPVESAKPRPAEKITFVKVNDPDIADVELPDQFFKDVLLRPSGFTQIIRLGGQTFTLDGLGTEGDKINAAKDFIKKTKQWVDSNFEKLDPIKKQAIFMSVLQNVTQGMYEREAKATVKLPNRNFYSRPSLPDFKSFYSVEINVEKLNDDTLQLSGKTVSNFYIKDTNKDNSYNQFYEGTCTFVKNLSDFNPTLALTSEKKFTKPWEETEVSVKVSYRTSTIYLQNANKKIEKLN
jgi:hypothetical protein